MTTINPSGVSQISGISFAVPRSTLSQWVTAITDLTQTAANATELRTPLTFADAASHIYRLSADGGTRLLTRMAYDYSHTLAPSTLARVRFYGIDAAGYVTRLDNSNATANGLVIPSDATADGYDEDETEHYGNLYDLSGIDILGCRQVFAVPDQALAWNGGDPGVDTILPRLEIKIIN
jgi:hypothetical protein